MQENIFEQYYFFNRKDGKITGVNAHTVLSLQECFSLFESLYNHAYGSIEKDNGLISIHSGGWSENETLIEELKKTTWWKFYHQITVTGGHYFFNINNKGEKYWKVIKSKKE